LLGLLTVIVLYLGFKTAKAVIAKGICLPEG
jgi:hypothetical protein